MWRRSSREIEHPTDDAWREALRLNDDHIRGLTRLDQELVYVPLTGLGGALFAVLTSPRDLMIRGEAIGVLMSALGIVAGVVLAGLWRNHQRHAQLIAYRRRVTRALQLPCFPESRDLAQGRRIYACLYLIAWSAGGAALVIALAT